MKALLVSVNGKRICLAGVGDSGVLASSVTWVRRADNHEALQFHVGSMALDGLASVWNVPQLGVGDEVTIKIIEADEVDPPSNTTAKGMRL